MTVGREKCSRSVIKYQIDVINKWVWVYIHSTYLPQNMIITSISCEKMRKNWFSSSSIFKCRDKQTYFRLQFTQRFTFGEIQVQWNKLQLCGKTVLEMNTRKVHRQCQIDIPQILVWVWAFWFITKTHSSHRNERSSIWMKFTLENVDQTSEHHI